MKAPRLKLLLRFLPSATSFGGSVPKEYFTVCWNVSRSTHDDHVSDEAAVSVTVTAVVDVGSFDEDASGMIDFLSFLLLGRIVTETGLQGGSRAAEAIEGDDSLD